MELFEPPFKEASKGLGQLCLIVEIDDVNPPAGIEAFDGMANRVPPRRDHRDRVGKKDLVEDDAKIEIICQGFFQADIGEVGISQFRPCDFEHCGRSVHAVELSACGWREASILRFLPVTAPDLEDSLAGLYIHFT